MIDTNTLIAQIQYKVWKSLKRYYQYDLTLKPGQEFLLSHVNSTILQSVM
jgi:hypothetical protein